MDDFIKGISLGILVFVLVGCLFAIGFEIAEEFYSESSATETITEHGEKK